MVSWFAPIACSSVAPPTLSDLAVKTPNTKTHAPKTSFHTVLSPRRSRSSTMSLIYGPDGDARVSCYMSCRVAPRDARAEAV